MKKFKCVMAVVLVFLLAQSSVADRKSFNRPDFGVELGNTATDNQVFEPSTGNYVYLGSEATVKYDESTGTYYFRFKAEDTKWYEAKWTLSSAIEATVSAQVRAISNESGFLYTFDVEIMSGSPLQLKRVTVKTDSNVLSSNESEPGWRGRELPKGWESNLWSWTRSTVRLTAVEMSKPGSLFLTSSGLPTPMPCWIRGDSPGFETNQELPSSIDRFYAEREDILTDAAKGTTVAPGLETVEISALLTYFDMAIEQGWLEEGTYRDELKALLETALKHHEAKDTKKVLSDLSTIQEKVGAVYGEDNSPILSEAYALLHFNIAYLLENYESDLLDKEAVTGISESNKKNSSPSDLY